MGEFQFNIDNKYIIFLILFSNLSYLHYSLNNARNECGRNVIFQLLFHLPPIRHHVLNQNNYSGKLTTELRTLFSKMQSSSSSFYTPLSQFLYPKGTISNPGGKLLTPKDDDITKYNKWFSTDQGMSKLIVV